MEEENYWNLNFCLCRAQFLHVGGPRQPNNILRRMPLMGVLMGGSQSQVPVNFSPESQSQLRFWSSQLIIR